MLRIRQNFQVGRWPIESRLSCHSARWWITCIIHCGSQKAEKIRRKIFVSIFRLQLNSDYFNAEFFTFRKKKTNLQRWRNNWDQIKQKTKRAGIIRPFDLEFDVWIWPPVQPINSRKPHQQIKKKVDKFWQEKNFVVFSFVLWAENLWRTMAIEMSRQKYLIHSRRDLSYSMIGCTLDGSGNLINGRKLDRR